MTTFLLIILVLVELARLILQYRSGKRLYEESYAQSVEARNFEVMVREQDMNHVLEYYGDRGFELVSVLHRSFDETQKEHYFMLFFTKKKVKNFAE